MMEFQKTINGKQFLSDVHRIAIALEKIAKALEPVKQEDHEQEENK
jgi:hypothetical protein